MKDSAVIKIKAGNGGDGLASFRREKYKPKGGPWGGDGGKGGDIYIEANPHVTTLSRFRYKKDYKAENGGPGMKKLMAGANGEDKIIEVPKGTMVFDSENNLIIDLKENGQRFKLAQGGKGGLGNWHFKSSTNQAPLKATPGIKREVQEIRLELKVLADIGLVGLPSAGKSTLLNALTNANAKTAEYHFTTLEPNLGIMDISNYSKNASQLVLADIPGLIEGASEGKGLGYDFLKHIERTSVLIHVLDGYDTPENILKNYRAIRNELSSWNKEILKKPEIVAVNKNDLSEVRDQKNEIIKNLKKEELFPIFISAATNENLEELIKEVIKAKDIFDKEELKRIEKEKNKKQKLVFSINELPNKRIVFKNSSLENETSESQSSDRDSLELE